MMSGYNHFKNLGMLTGYAQSKGVPMPKAAVLLTGAMMFLGGLGILLGAYIELSVLLPHSKCTNTGKFPTRWRGWGKKSISRRTWHSWAPCS